MLRLQVLRQNDRHLSAGKMTEVHFRKAELHVVCSDGDVATGHDRKASTKHPAVNFCDHRLRHFAQNFIAPLARFLTDLVAHAFRLRVHLDKILLQVLPGAKTLARPGNDDHPRVLVVTQLV